MGVLKRKEERTATVTVRVPASVKAELDRLRHGLTAAGFDFNGSLTDCVVRLTRQMREELAQVSGKGISVSRANGAVVG
jgi:hypothetical protein